MPRLWTLPTWPFHTISPFRGIHAARQRPSFSWTAGRESTSVASPSARLTGPSPADPFPRHPLLLHVSETTARNVAAHRARRFRVGECEGRSRAVLPCRPSPFPRKEPRSYFNDSAPSLATCASCSEAAPDTPTAPTIFPSTTNGIPPSTRLAPASLSSHRLAPPCPTKSWNTLVGRR